MEMRRSLPHRFVACARRLRATGACRASNRKVASHATVNAFLRAGRGCLRPTAHRRRLWPQMLEPVSNLRTSVFILSILAQYAYPAVLPAIGNHFLCPPARPKSLQSSAHKWVEDHKNAWQFGGLQNVNFGPDVWREHAMQATGIEVARRAAVVALQAVPPGRPH